MCSAYVDMKLLLPRTNNHCPEMWDHNWETTFTVHFLLEYINCIK